MTVSTFSGRLGETFHLVSDASPAEVSLELVDVTQLDDRPSANSAEPGGRRTPFSIVFRAPADVLLPQRIYRLEHDPLGALDLFLVPIGPDEQGMRYEAVFS